MDKIGDKKCYQSCEFQSEKLSITSTAYPSKNTFENRDEMCLILQKLRMICNDEIKFQIFEEFYFSEESYPKNRPFCDLVEEQFSNEICSKNFTVPSPEKSIDNNLYQFIIKYTRDNIVKMKFFFKEPYHTHIVKDVTMTWISFLGTAGGLMGLCTGMSIVSIFEILYYCVKFFSNLKPKSE